MTEKRDESLKSYLMRVGVPAAFSSVIILLCCYKIITQDSREYEAVYWSTLTATSASWLPSPVRRTKDETDNKC